jgi:hypothetical protein
MPLRMSNSRFLTGIGFSAGIFYAAQNSMQRLMGLEENTTEVRRYGAMSAADLEAHAARIGHENLDLISTPPSLNKSEDK